MSRKIISKAQSNAAAKTMERPEISLDYAHSCRSNSPSGDQQAPSDTKLAFLDLLYLAAPHLWAFYQSWSHSRLYYKERALRGKKADSARDRAEPSPWQRESRTTGLDRKPIMFPCALALYHSTASSGQNDDDWTLRPPSMISLD